MKYIVLVVSIFTSSMLLAADKVEVKYGDKDSAVSSKSTMLCVGSICGYVGTQTSPHPHPSPGGSKTSTAGTGGIGFRF